MWRSLCARLSTLACAAHASAHNGPHHVNLVINNGFQTRSCCIFGWGELKPGWILPKILGTPTKSLATTKENLSYTENVATNQFLTTLPPQLFGRVDLATWLQFIASVNELATSKPTFCCLAVCYGCAPHEFKLEHSDCAALRQQWQAKLGCASFELAQHKFTEYNSSDEGPTWQESECMYLHLTWPPETAVAQPQPALQPQPMFQQALQPMPMQAGMVMVMAPQGVSPMMVPAAGGGAGQVVYVNPVSAVGAAAGGGLRPV